MLSAYQHQLSLEAERRSYGKFRKNTTVQPVPVVQSVSPTSAVAMSVAPPHTLEDGDVSGGSLHAGLDPGPSASQVNSTPAGDMQEQMSNVLRVMSQFATFLGMSGTSKPTTLKEVVQGVVKETVIDEVANYLSVSAPPLPTAVTSGAPPSTDHKQLIVVKQVGLAGEGRLAAGTSMDPTPSLASVGVVDFQDSVGLDPVQPHVVPTPHHSVPSGVGKRPSGEEGGHPPTKLSRLDPKDLHGRVKHSQTATQAHGVSLPRESPAGGPCAMPLPPPCPASPSTHQSAAQLHSPVSPRLPAVRQLSIPHQPPEPLQSRDYVHNTTLPDSQLAHALAFPPLQPEGVSEAPSSDFRHMSGQNLARFGSPPPVHLSPRPLGDPGHLSSGEDAHPTGDDDSSDFVHLAQFIYSQFEDSKGSRINLRARSPGPGQEDFVPQRKVGSFTPFRWSRPMTNSAKLTDRLVSDRVHAGLSAVLPYTRRQMRRCYEVSDDAQKGKGSILNPSMARSLRRNASDLRSSISGHDMLRLEEAVRGIREIQNFQFWIFGAVSRLVKLGDAVPNKDTLMAQAVESMQHAMQSAARETTTVLSNLMTFRREAVLKGLPSSFSSSDKASLLLSSVDSPFLFEEDKVNQARQHADFSTTKSFQEAAAAALRKKPQPAASPLAFPAANRPSTSGYLPQRQLPSSRRPNRPDPSRPAHKSRGTSGSRRGGFRR